MIHIDLERAQARDFDRFCRTVTTVGEGQLVCQAASTIPWNGIPHEGASWQIPSNPVGDIIVSSFDLLRHVGCRDRFLSLAELFSSKNGWRAAGWRRRS